MNVLISGGHQPISFKVPSKKKTTIRDVKRYLQVATLGQNGLLVVEQSLPFQPRQYLTIIPRRVLSGLLTALHLRLNHPSKHQLQQVFQRYFYALDFEKEITTVSSSCAQCAAIAKLPGLYFACDIMRRCRQKIIFIRDCFSSFTRASIISDERASTIQDAVIQLTTDLKSPDGAEIRVDGATAMQSLVNDSVLIHQGLFLVVGCLKHLIKNPIAEKAVLELESEIKKAKPEGGTISPTLLAVVVNTLNSRLRNRGLSATEILFQRDNQPGSQITFSDAHMADEQYHKHLKNHPYSAKSKATKGSAATKMYVYPGDLVFLKDDGIKHTAHDWYIVSSYSRNFIFV